MFSPLVITPEIPFGCDAIHPNVAPIVALLKVTKAELSPEQIICGAGEKVTAGLGFTTIVNDCDAPIQVEVPLAKVGVTVIVAVTGKAVLFTALKVAIFPDPLLERPMLTRLFVQLYVVVPPVFPVPQFMALVGRPLQTV